MADKLDIRVGVDTANNQTVSKFYVTANGKVTFHNESTSASLQVDFAAPLLLCKGSTPQTSITVAATKSEELKVCNNAAEGNTFKYTATIAGSAPEDPIIIIEKSTIGPGLVATATVAVAGAVAGALILKGFQKLKAKSQPA